MNVYNPNLAKINLPNIIGLDTEFNSLDTLTANISGISINDPINKINYALDINSGIYSHEELVDFIQKIASLDVVIGHNIKVDIAVLYSNFGILLRNNWCTMLASQKIDNGLGYLVKKENLTSTKYVNSSDKIYFTGNMVGGINYLPSPHGLHSTILRYLGIELSESIDKKRIRQSFIGLSKGKTLTTEQLEYMCSDVEYLYPLYCSQLKYIEDRKLQHQIKLENTTTPVLVKMEHKGCLVDKEQHKQNIKDWKNKVYEIELKLDNILVELGQKYIQIRGGMYANKRLKQEVIQTSMFGVPEKVIENENKGNVNYASSSQVLDIFRKLDLPLPTDDSGKISLGEEPIKMYITTYPDSPLKEFLNILLEHREYTKLLSTYGENLLLLLDNSGRMRTNYTQCFTDTNRLASSAIIKDQLGLNLANIPKRADIRKIFIPDPGYSFIDSDMTGQELITVASYSKEPVLIKAFEEGFDHHSFLASISYSIIFGQKVEIKNSNEDITINGFIYNVKKLRDEHKTALFAKIYLGGPKRIFAVLNKYLCNHVPADKRLEKAEEVSKALDKALPKLMKWLLSKVDEVKHNGYVVTEKLGCRRYFDEPKKAYGDAANFPIQACGAMAIKTALINIDRWFIQKSKELGIKEEELGWIAMSIYDQNLCCLNDNYLDLAPEIQQIMADSLTYYLDGMQGSSDLNIRKWWGK